MKAYAILLPLTLLLSSALFSQEAAFELPDVLVSDTNLQKELTGKGTNVCDYSGENIYRAFSYKDTLRRSDLAPSLLRNEPCVKAAYGGVVPTNLYAKIYPFVKNDTDVIGVNFDDKNNPKTKLFVFVCRDKNSACANQTSCIFTYDPNGSNSNVPLRACDKFYYFVVTGERGASFSDFQIIPNGPCPGSSLGTTSGDLECGKLKQGTLFNGGQYPTNEGVPYNNDGCIKTTRPYTGGDDILNFKLVYDAVASIRVVCKSAIGLRLFDGECLVRCMGAAENRPPLSDTAVINIRLTGGVRYFLLIDKATPGPSSENYSVLLNCDNRFSIAGDDAPCPVNNTGGHTIELGTGAYNFETGTDKLILLYPDNGVLRSNDKALIWTPTNGTFMVPPDAPGGLKCSYADNDAFQIQVNGGNGRSIRRLSTAFSTDPNLRSTFGANGKSKIMQLVDLEEPIKFYVTSPSLQTIRPEGINDIPVNFFSNQGNWRANLPAADKAWISYQDIVYANNQTLELDILANPGIRPRQARIEFVSENRPQELRRSVDIRQTGRCQAPPITITADKTTICNGETVRLTAQPAAVGGQETADLQFYNWSVGAQRTQAISVTPTNNTTYRVTITNKDCGVTATATIAITVVAGGRPPAPSLRAEGAVCFGGSLPVLRVNPPTGTTISWYDSNGNLLAQNNDGNFTPNVALIQGPGVYTFFAAAVQGICSSAERTAVKLQVQAVPVITPTIRPATNIANIGSISLVTEGGRAPYTYRWSQAGTELPGKTTALLDGLSPGTYGVTVTDANGCSVSNTALVISQIVSSSEPEWSNKIRIYPNPTNGQFTLTFDHALTQPVDVMVTDVLGRLIVRRQISTATAAIFDLSGHTSGLYFVHFFAARQGAVRAISLTP